MGHIYDCFMFNDELDILDTRFAELYDAVDRFVLVEATHTHSYNPKPLYFKDNLRRYERYLNKVSHVVQDDLPTPPDPWAMERHQRDGIMRALGHCQPDDIIITSDCDEIPSPEAVKKYKVSDGIMILEMDLYYYDMNTMGANKWPCAKICSYADVVRVGAAQMRFEKVRGVIPNGGKHLSYFGGVDRIIKKLEDYSHQEYNKPEYKNREYIQKAINEGLDLFGRSDIKFCRKGISSYKDVVPDYKDYLSRQMVKYAGFERDNPHWVEGQKKYITSNFVGHSREAKILDIACGDGVGLQMFKEMGFKNVAGLEYNADKAKAAKSVGYEVFQADMHNLSMFKDGSFDIVYSSHSLEHAYNPRQVIQEFYRILVPSGLLYVVLPFPDMGPDDAHGGKYELQTHRNDVNAVAGVFNSMGFSTVNVKTDSFREAEIWITMSKPL